jgi:hypothetical protein
VNALLSRLRAPVGGALLLAASFGPLFAQAKNTRSDLLPLGRRAASVDTAAQLTAAPKAAALPPGVVNPFNPASFNTPDPEEARLAAEAAEAARRAGAVVTRPTTPRELLAAIAAEIKPTGVAVLGSESILLIGSRKLRVGDPIAATFDGKPFTVTVTGITRTSFTLRLNGEEFTRPIKSGNIP